MLNWNILDEFLENSLNIKSFPNNRLRIKRFILHSSHDKLVIETPLNGEDHFVNYGLFPFTGYVLAEIFE